MARALLGHIGPGQEHILALEIARLRRRVEELEAEVAQLRQRDHSEMDMELHRLAEAAQPALA